MDTNQRLVTSTQSTLITLCESKVKHNEKHVLLKMQRSGKQADHYYYWIGRNTPFRELMIDYTQRIGVSLNSMRFVFDGSAIMPLSSAKCLKLEDGDSIDVIQRASYKGNGRTLICMPRAKGEMSITLKVGVIGDVGHLRYLIGRNTRLENMFLDYADQMCRFYETTEFFITRNGRRRRLDPKKTADGLKMEDGDIIIVETKTTLK